MDLQNTARYATRINKIKQGHDDPALNQNVLNTIFYHQA